AKQLWPNEDPIGQKLEFGPDHTVCTVVGVVANVKMYYLRAKPERQMYVAMAQFPSQTIAIVARTAGNAPALNTSMRDAIGGVEGDQPVSSIERMDTLVAVSNSGDRILTKLVAFFGLLSMLLGAIGIYGLTSQQVSQRTQEIGIRLALGASRGGVMKMV